MGDKDDMTLSEFLGLSSARDEEGGNWCVSFSLKDGSKKGSPCSIMVYDCDSEYEAKERVFLYLKEKIAQKNEGK